MSWLARVVYRALVRREKERARRKRRLPDPGEGDETVAPHLQTGRRGENLAYWYLRGSGYTIVARNYRLSSDAGEFDLVGWDGPVLAFIEVKTRTSLAAGLPEEALSAGQRQRIVRAAQSYLRRLPRKDVTYRFDVVSVAWSDETGLAVRLIRDAYQVRRGEYSDRRA